MILPVFYLIHGEHFNSNKTNSNSSYQVKFQGSDVKIVCRRCADSPFAPLEIKFKASKYNSEDGPTEIQAIKDYQISNEYHFDHFHKVHEIPLYPYSKKKIGTGNKYVHRKQPQ